jgi:hypothetical protein
MRDHDQRGQGCATPEGLTLTAAPGGALELRLEIIREAQRPLNEPRKLDCVDQIGAAVFRVFTVMMIALYSLIC